MTEAAGDYNEPPFFRPLDGAAQIRDRLTQLDEVRFGNRSTGVDLYRHVRTSLNDDECAGRFDANLVARGATTRKRRRPVHQEVPVREAASWNHFDRRRAIGIDHPS